MCMCSWNAYICTCFLLACVSPPFDSRVTRLHCRITGLHSALLDYAKVSLAAEKTAQ